jgi:HD-GYP domain-containing protein (c-di-GMP phosphodiesterase class II)
VSQDVKLWRALVWRALTGVLGAVTMAIAFALADTSVEFLGAIAGMSLIGYAIFTILAGDMDFLRCNPANRPLELRNQESLWALIHASGLDDRTVRHLECVSTLAVELGRDLGLTDHEVMVLYWAARLHDVGMADVPATIREKSGGLVLEEYEQVWAHCKIGADKIVRVSPALTAIANLVAAHHERWDGQGYPMGVAGEAIPIGARVLAVVDTYDALTCDRPYRPRFKPQAAFQVILAESGTHFDPTVVVAFERFLICRGLVTQVRYPLADTVQSSRYRAVISEQHSELRVRDVLCVG